MARYLVTGGAGFIGSHVVEALVAKGHQVRVLDDLSSGRLENLQGVKDKVEFLKGDIRDRNLVAKAVQGIERIIHEAAWRSVPKSMGDAVGYFDVDTLAVANLLDQAVKAKVQRAVCVSSSSVYGDTQKFPQAEDDPVHPLSPYGGAKLAGEVVCETFYRAYGLETVALRYFNVFGPRQSLEDEYAVVIPKFIVSLMRKESPPVYSDGKQSRDFTYVSNVVEATVLSSEVPGIGGEVLNIALGEEHTVLDILDELNKIMGLSIKPAFKPPRPGDVRRTLVDPSKTHRLLKWKGSVPFAEGLKRTVAWFREHPPA